MTRHKLSLFLALLLLGFLLPLAEAAEHGVILQYHHVALDTPPSTSIAPAEFRAHMEYLRDNDYTVIPLDEMIERLRNQEDIAEKAVAITFDDGYLSIFEEAFPLLQGFDYPFTVFISTQPIDDTQANFMNWSQIRALSDAGVLIANHMVDHPYMLTRLVGEGETEWIERMRNELLLAEERIK